MIELSSPHIRIPPISPTVIYERILPFLSASVNLYLAIRFCVYSFLWEQLALLFKAQECAVLRIPENMIQE